MTLIELINVLHAYISGNVDTQFGKLAKGLWDVFSLTNGNPENTNSGVGLFLMLFFTFMLIIVLHLKTTIIFDTKHIIAYVGTLCLVFKILTMIGFQWAWQIGLSDDSILHLLSPPLEHFWGTMFFFCIAYYTLNLYKYYPGALRKILYFIPPFIVGFFVYSTIQWKDHFFACLPTVMTYMECPSDFQNHLMIGVVAGYTLIVTLAKWKEYHLCIVAFWGLTAVEHLTKTVAYYYQYEPPELATIFTAMGIWAIPLLTLHFINSYVVRYRLPTDRKDQIVKGIRFIKCEDCVYRREREENEQNNRSN